MIQTATTAATASIEERIKEKPDGDGEEEEDGWNGGLVQGSASQETSTGSSSQETTMVNYRRRRTEYQDADELSSALGVTTNEGYYDNLVPHLEEQLGKRSTWRTLEHCVAPGRLRDLYERR